MVSVQPMKKEAEDRLAAAYNRVLVEVAVLAVVSRWPPAAAHVAVAAVYVADVLKYLMQESWPSTCGPQERGGIARHVTYFHRQRT